MDGRRLGTLLQGYRARVLAVPYRRRSGAGGLKARLKARHRLPAPVKAAVRFPVWTDRAACAAHAAFPGPSCPKVKPASIVTAFNIDMAAPRTDGSARYWESSDALQPAETASPTA